MTTRKKTTEEITKANLAKTLSKMKTSVAETEELWLEVFCDVLPYCKTDEAALDAGMVPVAARIADAVLDEYEKRWGK